MHISKSIIDALNHRLNYLKNPSRHLCSADIDQLRQKAEKAQHEYETAVAGAWKLDAEKEEIEQFLKDNNETGELSISTGE